MSTVEIDYAKAEAFLKGEVSLEDLDTRRFNRYDIVVIAHMLIIPHLNEVTYLSGEMRILEKSLYRTLNAYSPMFITNSHTTASRELGLHISLGRGRPTRLTLPVRLIELVQRYVDKAEGGLVKFAELKRAETRSDPEDGITPAAAAAEAIERLHSTYSPAVIELIRRDL